MFMYHAGSGGEFIAKTFAEYHPGYHRLPYEMNSRNQCHSIGVIHYSSQWVDPNDPETWVHNRFEKKYEGLGYVFKDHPTNSNLEYYAKYMPKLNVVYLAANKYREHFARLVFAKVSRKIKTPVTVEFIRDEVNDLLNEQDEQRLIDWSAQYDWVWSNEIMICNTKQAKGEDIFEFKHEDNLDKYITDHAELDLHFQEHSKQYTDKFNIFHVSDIDSLYEESTSFWHDLENVFPGIDIEKAIHDTNIWIEKNHRLLNGR